MMSINSTRTFQNVLSIDNIYQIFNQQPHFWCQYPTNIFMSEFWIDNIENVLNQRGVKFC